MRSFRIVIAGHGNLPAALLGTAELICGRIPDLAAVGLQPGETPDHFAAELRAAIGHASATGRTSERSSGGRVLVLTDLLGGTPFNVATAIGRRSPRVVCLSGTNLAMVVEAAMTDSDLDDAVVERLLEVGRAGIVETERHRARRAS